MGVDSMAQAPASRNAGGRNGSANARVLKIHVWAPSFGGFGGGITAFSRELALGLGKNHELELFGKADAPGLFDGQRLWGPTGPAAMRTFQFASGCMRSAMRDKPARIVSTHVNFGRIARYVKLANGTPFTLIAHGIDIHPGVPEATLAALRSADHITAVSEWTRRRVLDLGRIDGSRISILPNTFDESRFTPGDRPRALIERYGILPAERIILTVARLSADERYKGYDRIVRALPSLQATGHVRFLLAGVGDDRSRVERLAREAGVERQVTFTGFVPDEELPDHYRLADVFAMPSTGEGFGIVFLESMGCGTPVVAGNRDGSVDALDGGRLGKLVDPEDVESIAEGIRSVLAGEGPELWFNRAALRDAVVAKFGRAAFRERLEDSLGL